MRKIKDVLRLHFGRNLSARQIAHSLEVSRNTVTQYLRRAQAVYSKADGKLVKFVSKK